MSFFLLTLRHGEWARLPQGGVIQGRHVGKDIHFCGGHVVEWGEGVRKAFLEELGQRPFGHLRQFAHRAIQVLGQFKDNRLGWHTYSPQRHRCRTLLSYYIMRGGKDAIRGQREQAHGLDIEGLKMSPDRSARSRTWPAGSTASGLLSPVGFSP
jgi:hypothetical protein